MHLNFHQKRLLVQIKVKLRSESPRALKQKIKVLERVGRQNCKNAYPVMWSVLPGIQPDI